MTLVRVNGRRRDDRNKEGRLYHRKMEGPHRRGEGFSRWIYDSFGGVRISRGPGHDFFKKSHRTRGRGGLNFYYGSGLRLAPFFSKERRKLSLFPGPPSREYGGNGYDASSSGKMERNKCVDPRRLERHRVGLTLVFSLFSLWTTQKRARLFNIF